MVAWPLVEGYAFSYEVSHKSVTGFKYVGGTHTQTYIHVTINLYEISVLII